MLIMLMMMPSSLSAPPAPSMIDITVKYWYRRDEKILSVDMNKTDTVADLKTRIEKELKIVPERQKLKQGYCDSVWLNNNDTLEHLVRDPTIFLSIIKLDQFEITLKYGNEWNSIEVQKTDTVAQLREKAKDIFNIPLERLIMSKFDRDYAIGDNENTMDECDIDEDETICVSWDKFEIKVKFGKKEWPVEVEATEWLVQLMKKIKDLTGIPTERQKLRFPDKTEIVYQYHNMMVNDIVKGDTISMSSDAFKISVSYELESPCNKNSLVVKEGPHYKNGSVKVEVYGEETVKIVKGKIKAMIEERTDEKLKGRMELKNSNGEILENDKTMDDYGTMDTLHCAEKTKYYLVISFFLCNFSHFGVLYPRF
ncbi:hypothetical protein niasHS_018072 [Heterodera schachtii]|uniref:Ubiquitin-like domain-containing protein n=1 Tax=Heterodera schachtii TaxID=97005 RepID=A0ABD2HV42_HETSC